MSRKSWFLSLSLPILSLLSSAVFIILSLVGGYAPDMIFIMIFGAICGGIVPTVMIVHNRIDTSEFLIGKITLFIALVIGIVYSLTIFWNIWVSDGYNILVLPILMIIAELIFAALQKTDIKTKICLAMSSAAYVYLGFAIDFARSIQDVPVGIYTF